MFRTTLILILAVGLLGCSGEAAPEVGDAKISKGIEYRELPKPTSPGAAQAAQQYAQQRSSRR